MNFNTSKKIVVVAIIFIIIFWIVGVQRKKDILKHKEELDKESVVLSDTNQNPEEITIYDIEDGYLKVPFNKEADKHNYDWSKLSKTNGMYKYEDDNYTSKLGIDVSSHQKDINWKKVKEAGIDFVIIRIGYRGYGESGKVTIDSYFEKNYEGARAAGLDVGVYFFSQAITVDEVKEEAEFVFKHLKGKEISYPVVYDLEKIKNEPARTDNLTSEQINDMTLEFCNLVKEKGYTPSVYGNSKTFTTKMALEKFNDIDKWYAGYPEAGNYDYPFYPYEFNLWQYTETGTLPGVNTQVDINIEFIKK